MKKAISLSIVFAIAIFAASAAVSLRPMPGTYNINLASDKYTIENIDSPAADELPSESDYHTMIAGGGSDSANSMTVEITSNAGFNFVSNSNPDIIRPFTILIVARSGTEHSFTGAQADISNTGSSSGFYTHTFSSSSAGIWLEFILVLPGTVDGSSINVDGIEYPLIAGEYSANLTITITAEGETKTLPIPLAGYYNPNSSAAYQDSAMNITIQPYAAASNLDIAGLAASGEWISIADIEVYYYKGTESQTSELTPRMFLSASNDPYMSASEGFNLVHSSVTPGTPHTSYNSIGYRLATQSYPKDGETTAMTDQLIFEGPEYVQSGNYTTLQNKSSASRGDFIYPSKQITDSFGSVAPATYYYWKNNIYLSIDPMAVETMNAGLYEDTIYFHAIYE